MYRLSYHLRADRLHLAFENPRDTGNLIAFISKISLDLQVLSTIGFRVCFTSIAIFLLRIDGKSFLRILYSYAKALFISKDT